MILFVPSAPIGSGFTDPYVLPEPRYRIPPFSRVIPGLGAMALGIARTAIETLTGIAADKQLPAYQRRYCAKTMVTQIRVSQAKIARSLSTAVSVRQPGAAVEEQVSKTGEAPVELRGAGAACCLACRLQRRQDGRPHVRCGWCDRALHEFAR